MGNWDNDEQDAADEFDSSDSPNDTIVCQNCGASIYEDSVRCPRCGWYVTSDTSAWSGRSIWWILLGLAGIVAMVVAFILFR